jgi:hypothetical protein
VSGGEASTELMLTMEAEVAVGSLLGIPPSSVRLCAVVAVDDAGKVRVAGPGLVSPAAKRRIVKLLDDAAGLLREQVR